LSPKGKTPCTHSGEGRASKSEQTRDWSRRRGTGPLKGEWMRKRRRSKREWMNSGAQTTPV